MFRLIMIFATLIFLGTATTVIAADVYTYEASKGTVTFNHKAHQARVNGDCSKCHEGTPAKFEVNKEVAHKTLCKKCHKAMNGPTRCNDCHKK